MDSITNTITIIRNGYLAKKQIVSVPRSRLSEEVAKKILEAGFLEAVEVDAKASKLKISLGYQDGEPLISCVERISKPSLRFYTSAKKIPKILGGRGEVIISTPKGILTGREAKKAKAGGELLLKVW